MLGPLIMERYRKILEVTDVRTLGLIYRELLRPQVGVCILVSMSLSKTPTTKSRIGTSMRLMGRFHRTRPEHPTDIILMEFSFGWSRDPDLVHCTYFAVTPLIR